MSQSGMIFFIIFIDKKSHTNLTECGWNPKAISNFRSKGKNVSLAALCILVSFKLIDHAVMQGCQPCLITRLPTKLQVRACC